MIKYRNFEKTYIIAEIGVNHDGSLESAINLVNLAQESGADAVKFQTFTSQDLARRSTPKVKYQTETTPKDLSHFEMLKKYQFDMDQFLELEQFALYTQVQVYEQGTHAGIQQLYDNTEGL